MQNQVYTNKYVDIEKLSLVNFINYVYKKHNEKNSNTNFSTADF